MGRVCRPQLTAAHLYGRRVSQSQPLLLLPAAEVRSLSKQLLLSCYLMGYLHRGGLRPLFAQPEQVGYAWAAVVVSTTDHGSRSGTTKSSHRTLPLKELPSWLRVYLSLEMAAPTTISGSSSSNSSPRSSSSSGSEGSSSSEGSSDSGLTAEALAATKLVGGALGFFASFPEVYENKVIAAKSDEVGGVWRDWLYARTKRATALNDGESVQFGATLVAAIANSAQRSLDRSLVETLMKRRVDEANIDNYQASELIQQLNAQLHQPDSRLEKFRSYFRFGLLNKLGNWFFPK
jgi:hypothetical protein